MYAVLVMVCWSVLVDGVDVTMLFVVSVKLVVSVAGVTSKVVLAKQRDNARIGNLQYMRAERVIRTVSGHGGSDGRGRASSGERCCLWDDLQADVWEVFNSFSERRRSYGAYNMLQNRSERS